jgi:hypothetical protein
VDLRTNSDYFPVQHQLTGFYNYAVQAECLYIIQVHFLLKMLIQNPQFRSSKSNQDQILGFVSE